MDRALLAAALPDVEIGQLLGEGGMAKVWAGTERETGEEVAIKVTTLEGPPVAPGGSPAQRRERHNRELIALHTFDHPNIVLIKTHGVLEDERPFLVLERVRGPSLAEVCAQGPSPPARALKIIDGVAAGLQHAHEKGVIHRDIKGSNVLWCPRHGPRVIDFGLVKSIHPGEVSLTGTGGMVGTHGVIPPEVKNGDREARPQIDVWGTGVLLEELLVGNRHQDWSEARARIAALAPEVRMILAGALAKDWKNRTPSMTALREQLKIAIESDVPVRPEAAAPRKKGLFGRKRRK